jgi:hypothetical protein
LKRLAALSIFIACLAATVAAQALAVRIDGDQLRLSAPRLHFLTGDALARLRDGAAVQYRLQVTLRTEKNGPEVARAVHDFAISYDLWEERFAVKRLGSSPKSISHLSAAAAEAWCLDNATIPVGALGAKRVVWVRLDYQAQDATPTAEDPGSSGFTLAGLVDIFSRRTRAEQVHGFEEAGPVRLDAPNKR